MRKSFLTQIITILASISLFFSSAHAQSNADSGLDAVLSTDTIATLRDPFQIPDAILKLKDSPRMDLEVTHLKDIRLNGVITGPKKIRALLSTPNGKTYFVSIGDRVGTRNGKITKIRSDAVTVLEYDTDLNGKPTQELFEMRIDGELSSLSEQR